MGLDLNKPAISVIITVFNSEKTLERCLNSVTSQSFLDFEAICVNDGSSDSSLPILERYAKNDSRFRIISQDNEGVAMARQVAMDAANGVFSIHVDSDDWIEPNMLEDMYSTAIRDESDMVICDIIKEWPDRKKIYPQKPRKLDSSIVLGQLFYDLHGSLCNKLIRNNIIRNNGIRFHEGLNSCEDQLFVMRVLSCGIKLSYINAHFYHYIIDKDNLSITQNWFKTPVSQRLLFLEQSRRLISTHEQMNYYREYVARIAYDYTFCNKEFCPDYRSSFKDYWKLIKGSSLPLVKKIIIYFYLIGLRIPRN